MSENKFYANDDSTAAQGSSENSATSTASSYASAHLSILEKATKAELYNLYNSSKLEVPPTTSISKPKVGDKSPGPQHHTSTAQENGHSSPAWKRHRSPSQRGRPSTSLGCAPDHADVSHQPFPDLQSPTPLPALRRSTTAAAARVRSCQR